MFAVMSLMLRILSSPCCDVICVGGYHIAISLLGLVFRWDQRLRPNRSTLVSAEVESNQRSSSSLTPSATHRWFRRISLFIYESAKIHALVSIPYLVSRKHATAPLCVVTVVMLFYDGYLSLFIACLVGRIVSGVWVSASFQIISRPVGRLGSVVRVSVSFQNFALRMSVMAVMLLVSGLFVPLHFRSFVTQYYDQSSSNQLLLLVLYQCQSLRN